MVRVPISPFVDTAFFSFQIAKQQTCSRIPLAKMFPRQRGGGGPNLCGPPGGKGPGNKAIKTVLFSLFDYLTLKQY